MQLVVCAVLPAFFFFCLFRSANSCIPGETVNSTKGAVRGCRLTSQNGTLVHGFFGIPFAQPPTNGLRWQFPGDTHRWNATRDATKFQPRCAQPDSKNENGQVYLTSEDCLYVNVYTPSLSNASLPVLVMIHGGGYVSGGADQFTPTGVINNLVSRGIIVVTFNYRLGAFGYLTSGDERLLGNFGLMDMVMAMRWTRDEIGTFGGDPRKITVYGISTGAHALSILLMYPDVAEIVNQAILQSGSALLPTSTNISLAATGSVEFTQQLGCGDWQHSDVQKVMHCARNKTTQQIINAAMSPIQFWRPVAADSFVDEQLRGRRPIRMMVGVNRDEHALFVAPDSLHDRLISSGSLRQWHPAAGFFDSFTQSDLRTAINNTLKLYNIPTESLAARIASLLYDDDESAAPPDRLHWFKQYVKLESDSVFFAPAYREATTMARHGSTVYLYSFDHVAALDRCDSPWRGVQHGDDLQYLLAMPGRLPWNRFAARNVDYAVADSFGNFVTNFVKTGNPSSEFVVWPPLQASEDGGVSSNYLSLSAMPTVRQRFHPRAAEFWSDSAWMLADMKR